MFAATRRPMMGSSTSHPVSRTMTTPSTTPSEVHTSVSRCCASARSVIERSLLPARNSTTATPPLSAVAASVTERPSLTFWSGCGSSSRSHAVIPIQTAAMIIRALSNPLEKYSALLWPNACSSYGEGQGRQGRHRGDEVDHGLGCVGEQSDRPREVVGPELEPDGDDRGRDR